MRGFLQARSAKGNVLLYVLIAIVLFGALSMMLTKQMDGDSATKSLDEGRSRLAAEDLINYATSVKTAVEQMNVLQNVLPADLNFVKPGEAGYDTAPHGAKVFHPAGGGVTLFNAVPEQFAAGSAHRGWVVQQGTNVEWTQTTAADVILSFVDVDSDVCREINKRIYKETSIPTTTADTSIMFTRGNSDDGDFTRASCPACNQRVSYCIKDGAGANVFYNIILSR